VIAHFLGTGLSGLRLVRTQRSLSFVRLRFILLQDFVADAYAFITDVGS
jgi:hypothetical protein